MVISLFEEKNCAHRHVGCKEDVDSELFELFLSARSSYIKEVVENRMKRERFVEMFVHSHYHIDCDIALCLNSHKMNLGIIKGLFSDERIVVAIVQKDVFTRQDFGDLLHLFFTEDNVTEPVSKKHLSFGCDFSLKQLDILSDISCKRNIFQVSDGCDMHALLHSLFECKQNIGIKVRNIRNVVILFDALLDCRLINHNWQSVIEKGRLLKSVKTGKYLKVSSLSSSLSKAKRGDHATATQYSIRQSVLEMLKTD